MNLFESQLVGMTTEDNAVYMEAVAQIFNTLFESEIETAKADPRVDLISIVEPLFAVTERIKSGKNPYLMTLLQHHDVKTGDTSFPERQLLTLTHNLDDEVTTDKQFFNETMTAFNQLCAASKISQPEAFKQNIKNALKQLKTPQERDNFTSLFKEYINALSQIKTGLQNFAASEEGKAMAKSGKQRGDKLVRATKNRIQGGAEGAVADAEIANPVDDGDGATKTGGRKITGKVTKPAEPEPSKDPYPGHIIGTVFTSNEPVIKITTPAEKYTATLNRIKTGLDMVFQSNTWHGEGNRVYKEAINITSDDNTSTITLTNTTPEVLKTKGAAIDMHYILMYCLALDAMKENDLLPENIGIANVIADRILRDQNAKPSNRKLLKLYPGNINALAGRLPTRSEISIAVGNTEDSECLCTAISAYMNDSGRSSNDKDEFDTVVSQLAASICQSEEADIDSADVDNVDFMSEATSKKTPEYFKEYLVSNDVFSKLMSADTAMTGADYNGSAEALVSTCIQNNSNKDEFDYYGTPVDTDAEMNQEDVINAIDEINDAEFGEDDFDDAEPSYKTRGSF